MRENSYLDNGYEWNTELRKIIENRYESIDINKVSRKEMNILINSKLDTIINLLSTVLEK